MVHEHQQQQPDPRKSAIIYRRVSTDTQVQGDESQQHQEAMCRHYAQRHNLDVVIVLKEAQEGQVKE